MIVKKRYSKNRIKSLGILLFAIIIPAIISTPLFTIFNKTTNNTDQDNNEKDDIRGPHFPTPSSSLPNADYFSYYKVITIDHTKVNGSSGHTNFPVLISIIDSDLEDKAQSNGNDIAFANSTAWLDHEIELYDPSYSFNEAQLIAWVRIPVLSATNDTFIFMFYGNSTMGSQENPTRVWDSNYKGVWHLKEDPGGADDIKDSTSNDNHGTSVSMWVSDQVSGQIDGSLDFDGINDYVNVGIVGPEIKTIEFWMNPDSLASYGVVNNTDFHSPNATGSSPEYNYWTNPTNAYNSDESFASASGFSPDQDYYDFSFNIPTNALIVGIEVSIEGLSGTLYQTARCRIRLSGNAGSEYTDYYELSWWSTTNDEYHSAGGPTNTWGKPGGWSPSEFSNTNFRVWLEESGYQVTLLVDHLRVRVYYRIPGDIAVIDINGNAQVSIDNDDGEIKAINFPGTPDIYINGTIGTKVGIGNWYYLVITDTTGVNASALDIARNISVYFDGIIDEVRLSNVTRSPDWIATEYNNQYDPDSFYFISEERTSLTDVQVNAFDLYGNSIPNVNISMIQDNKIIRSDIANASGSVMFDGVLSIEYKYNFTVSMISNIAPYHIIEINRTSEAILIEGESQTINLICNISRNVFNVVDIDGIPLDSGWIIVSNYSDPIQNCTIDQNGHATFRWLNNSAYNFTVWYRDINYNPSKKIVGTGDILRSQYNSEINVTAILTTVNFTLLTKDDPQPVDGANLILGNANLGQNIVNLTTDLDGKATLRWVNSSGINSNYSLQVSFYGKLWDFNIYGITFGMVQKTNFSVKAKAAYNISIDLSPGVLEEFETEIISLNPTSNINVEWGTKVTLRALFNVTKVPSGVEYENLTGSTYAEPMSYQIFEGSTLILSGIMPTENDYIGRHKKEIETDELETGIVYIIKIIAQKPGYVLPSDDIIMSLYLLENELILNQSENDDSPQSLSWQEIGYMSVKPYGIISEDFSIEYNMYNLFNGTFKFSIPSISNEWVLSRIVFNVYSVTFGVPDEGDIYLNITDDFGVKHDFDSSWDHYYHSAGATNGSWSNLEVILNKGDVTGGDIFNFTIDGTYEGDIDIIATSYFIRDKINVQYSKFNVTDSISILTGLEGWAIQNITFLIYDCFNTSTWDEVNLTSLTNLNITTNESYKYSLKYGDANGNGMLTIGDRIIYPLDNQFLFTIEANANITFHVIIKVEYIQEFFQNQYIEKINISKTEQDFGKTDTFQVKFIEKELIEDYATLVISGISYGLEFFLPSEIGMTITINDETSNIEDVMEGQGIFSLEGLEKDKILTALIETNLLYPVIFNLSFMIKYSRIVTYETKGIVNYSIIEKPEIYGGVQYYEDLGYYLLIINTSLLDANDYTIRFTITKANYISSIKDLKLFVLERYTLLNGSSDFFRSFEQIYVIEPVNFKFYYVDGDTYQPITDVDQKTYVWEYYDDEGNVIDTGQGALFAQGIYYVLDIGTERLKLGEYLIVVTLSKENYEYKTGLITLTIAERPTLINGESELSVIQENIYIGEAINFSFSYIDHRTNVNITNLALQSYIWEEFNATGDLINNGTGYLVPSLYNLYVLDFDTETRDPNIFKLVITLDKENYTSQTATILLNINIREFSCTLSDNFRNNQINIVKGENVVIEIHLIDLTRNNIDLLDAIVQLSVKGNVYTFRQIGNGTYLYELSTNNIDAFFTSKTLTGVIMISKEDYISEEFIITIVVEIEEIFPGIPTFYFLLGLITTISVVGSIVGYRVYKNVTTPTFVKRVRAMKKAIEGEKEISESLLYASKIEFIGERVKNKWNKIGLSLADILRIKIEKETLKRKISEDIKRREFKPAGLLLMKWDEKMGTKILARFPENLEVSDKTLMQIYGTHEYSGEKGIITLTVGMTNIISYYTGPEQAFYLLFFLNLDDDPDLYEGGMANIISIILENLEDDSYLQMIPYLFQRLSIYPSLSDEEILALNYQDEVKRLIINMLRDDGVIIKSELSIWLRDKALGGFIDLDAILLELAKKDIIKQISIKGIPSALIVLTTDLFMLRVPPVKLIEDPVNRGLPLQFAKTYPSEIKKFFQNYRPTEEDNLSIIEIFINPQVYETLRLLRSAIVTRQDLEKLSKKGVEDIYGVLKMLWDNQMIKVFQDENNIEYYALLSDFYMDLIFPKYILETIKTSYEQKSKSNKVLIEYLNALEDTYFELKKQEK